MALSDEQIEAYYREGFILLEKVARPEVIDAALAASDKTPRAGGGWDAELFVHDIPLQDATIHQLLVEPGVVDAVAQLFESPVRVWFGMLAVVPAESGTGLPWHQDNMYTPVSGRAANAFIALCDITPDNAGLWVAPRSHRRGILPNHPSEKFGGHREADTEPENPLQLPPMQKGDACIFDRHMLHRSIENVTSEHRYAYAAQYIEDNARMFETGKKDPLRMRVSDLRETFGQAGVLTGE
jgi:ectoine hydroxylase-related dioxygenase (phytanoyl-CoA dioxygenase family)